MSTNKRYHTHLQLSEVLAASIAFERAKHHKTRPHLSNLTHYCWTNRVIK